MAGIPQPRAGSTTTCRRGSSPSDSLVNPAVYDELGIEGGAKAARHNPNHQERIVRDLTKLTDFMSELGVINRVTRPLWKVLGLVS
jgi:hypothetical protein